MFSYNHHNKEKVSKDANDGWLLSEAWGSVGEKYRSQRWKHLQIMWGLMDQPESSAFGPEFKAVLTAYSVHYICVIGNGFLSGGSAAIASRYLWPKCSKLASIGVGLSTAVLASAVAEPFVFKHVTASQLLPIVYAPGGSFSSLIMCPTFEQEHATRFPDGFWEKNRGKDDASRFLEAVEGCRKRRVCQERMSKDSGVANGVMPIPEPGVQAVHSYVMALEANGGEGNVDWQKIYNEGLPVSDIIEETDWVERFVTDLDDSSKRTGIGEVRPIG